MGESIRSRMARHHTGANAMSSRVRPTRGARRIRERSASAREGGFRGEFGAIAPVFLGAVKRLVRRAKKFLRIEWFSCIAHGYPAARGDADRSGDGGNGQRLNGLANSFG